MEIYIICRYGCTNSGKGHFQDHAHFRSKASLQGTWDCVEYLIFFITSKVLLSGVRGTRRHSFHCCSQICSRGVQGWPCYKVLNKSWTCSHCVTFSNTSYCLHFQRNYHGRWHWDQPSADCGQRFPEARDRAETDTQRPGWTQPLLGQSGLAVLEMATEVEWKMGHQKSRKLAPKINF